MARRPRRSSREFNFAAKVDAWTKKTQARLDAVVKTAAEALVEEIIDRTPVDTGFLRASLRVSLDGPLPMREARPAEVSAFPRPEGYALVINGAELGDTIYVSFTASYAGYVEYGTETMKPVGMVRLSAQNWPKHVRDAVRQAKASVASRRPQ